jgi:hypothetical protein
VYLPRRRQKQRDADFLEAAMTKKEQEETSGKAALQRNVLQQILSWGALYEYGQCGHVCTLVVFVVGGAQRQRR